MIFVSLGQWRIGNQPLKNGRSILSAWVGVDRIFSLADGV
jgi:hypothetical protein